MLNKNPFLNQKAYKVMNSKRMPKSTPGKDVSKAKLATQAIKILKKVRENYQVASSIDAVKQTRKNYHLGNIRKTANFMNSLATLSPEKRQQVKQLVVGTDDKARQTKQTKQQKPVAQRKKNNISKSTGRFAIRNGDSNK